jgi:hypothetical protein
MKHETLHFRTFTLIKGTYDAQITPARVKSWFESILYRPKWQHSTFFSMALPAHSGPRSLTQFRNHFTQTVGLLGRVTSPSQGRYLNTGQHKHRINTSHTTKHPCLEWDSKPRSQHPSERSQFIQGCSNMTGADFCVNVEDWHVQVSVWQLWFKKISPGHIWTTLYFRPRGHCDRQDSTLLHTNLTEVWQQYCLWKWRHSLNMN